MESFLFYRYLSVFLNVLPIVLFVGMLVFWGIKKRKKDRGRSENQRLDDSESPS